METRIDLSDLDELLHQVLELVAPSGLLLRDGSLPAPRNSVSYGAAGVAYAIYRLACLRNDGALLSLADIRTTSATKRIEDPAAFRSDALGIVPETVGTISPYHTAAGVHCVQALISQALGDMVSRKESLEKFVFSSDGKENSLDLTIGRSSVLLGCSLIVEAAPAVTSVRELGSRVASAIWNEVKELKPISEAKEIKYLGIAHGWAGILYAQLRWCAATGSRLPDGVDERLQQLAACGDNDAGDGALRWARLVPFFSLLREADFMPGWCNGSAGFIHLWTLASKMLHDEHYLTLARKTARNVLYDPDQIDSLCCGLAGRAYALLNLYKCTGEERWLEGARRLAQQSAARTVNPGFPFHSLYKGKLGIALLCADLREPHISCMPFFENEGWPVQSSASSLSAARC